jgi:rare lipoprotein A
MATHEVASRRMLHVAASIAAALTLAGCAAGDMKLAVEPTIAPASIAAVETRAEPTARSRMRAFHTIQAHRKARKSFEGFASYYRHGSRVASGAPFQPHELTAAHRSLPFGTRVRVRDIKTGRSVVVVINDRGPFVHGRVLDLSLGAARALGMEGRGVNRVHAEVL